MTPKKKKRKRKATKPRARESDSPSGFDFGYLPLSMSVGSPTFVEQLNDADIFGVGYGFSFTEALQRRIPTISLVARNGSMLNAAFEEFNRWALADSGDAVEVAIVMQEDGGYTITIGQELDRLTRLFAGFDRAHRHMALGAVYIKRIDSTHDFVRQLAEYRHSFPSPVLLTGAQLPDPASRMSPLVDVVEVPGIKPILKFDLTVVTEAQATSHKSLGIAAALSYINPESKVVRRLPPGNRDARTPSEIADERERVLWCHFPITLVRTKVLASAIRAALGADIALEAWQVRQAIANAVLSRDIVGAAHYRGVVKRHLVDRIVEALTTRFEMADLSASPELDQAEIEAQIAADARFLLKQRLNRTITATTLSELQVLLRRHGFLSSETSSETMS